MNEYKLGVTNNDPDVPPDVSTYSSEGQIIESLGSERFSRFSRYSTLRRALVHLINKVKQFKAWRRGVNLSTFNSRRTRSNPSNHSTSRNTLTNPSATELKQAENLMMKTAQADAFTPQIRKAKIATSRDEEKRIYCRPINELVPIMCA